MKVHYFFFQFAHTIRQLFDLGSKIINELQGKIKEISFVILTELISTHINLEVKNNFQLRFTPLII